MTEVLTSGETLTDWYITGEIWCPDCASHFDLDCSLADVQKFTGGHACPEMEPAQ